MYSTDGIVLKRMSMGEADESITLYTREYGKLRLRARGIKKEGAKLKGHLEPFSLSHISFVLGKQGEQATHATTLSYWPAMRASVLCAGAARYIAEVAEQYCMPGQKDEELWELLMRNFSALEGMSGSVEGMRGFLDAFEKEFMAVAGYGASGSLTELGISVRRPFSI